MTKASQTFVVAASVSLVYFAALFRLLPISLGTTIEDEILPVLPWWSLVAFGSYALWTLGLGVYSFSDVPEAYKELLEQISVAKNDLRDKGVTVD